jgi:hypothetical protein
MTSNPLDRKQLLDARDEFYALLDRSGTDEREFQNLFSKHPYILSNSLPLRLEPVDIQPLGRPGKSEVDFIFYPKQNRIPYIYGSIEIKRPDTKILKSPRKNIITLSSDATTALAQAQVYNQELRKEFKSGDRPLVAMGNEEYIFLVLGMQAELEDKVSSAELRRQFDGLLPTGCRLFPYDTLLKSFERNILPSVHILVPNQTPKSFKSRGRIPLIDNQFFWQLTALECAERAHEEDFESRRGVYPLIVTNRGEAVLCIYNNSPYSLENNNSCPVRDEETEQFRQWLRQNKIAELSYAVYPEEGEDAGYSYAMLINIDGNNEEQQDQIINKLDEILRLRFGLPIRRGKRSYEV